MCVLVGLGLRDDNGSGQGKMIESKDGENTVTGVGHMVVVGCDIYIYI